MSKLAAIIFADGICSRKGRFEPLFPLGDGTVLSRCVDLFWSNDVRQVIVVAQRENLELEEIAKSAGAEVVYQKHSERSVFASLMTGVREFHKDVSGFFIMPVNVPLVRTKTVTRMIQAFEKNLASVVYPRFHGDRGYPPLVHGKLVPRMMEVEGDTDLCSMLRRFDVEAIDLDVVDRGIVHSVKDREGYVSARQWAEITYPLPEECEQLWDLYSTPHETREHCKAVARLGVRICDMLNEKRSDENRLDRHFVEGAALIHDVGKGMKRHDAVGGEWLAIHGYDDAADIVRHHSDLVLLPDDPITEREIVFLADKLIRGVTPVALDERYNEKMGLYGSIPDARRAIEGRHKRGREVLKRFEEELGVDLEALSRELLADRAVAETV